MSADEHAARATVASGLGAELHDERSPKARSGTSRRAASASSRPGAGGGRRRAARAACSRLRPRLLHPLRSSSVPSGAGSDWSPTGERSTGRSIDRACPSSPVRRRVRPPGRHDVGRGDRRRRRRSPGRGHRRRSLAALRRALAEPTAAGWRGQPALQRRRRRDAGTVLHGTRSPTTTAGSVPWRRSIAGVAGAPRLGDVAVGRGRARVRTVPGGSGHGMPCEVPAGGARPGGLPSKVQSTGAGGAGGVADGAPALGRRSWSAPRRRARRG